MSERKLAVLTLLAALPLGVLAAVLLVLSFRADQQRLKDERLALARTAAVATEAFVEGHLSTIATTALRPEFADPENLELRGQFAAILARNPDWQGLTLYDADGWNLQSASGTPPRTINIADRPYFQQAMRLRTPIVSPGVRGRASGRAVIAMAVPLEFRDGSSGLITASLPLDNLSARLRTQLDRPDVNVLVIDSQGQVIADTAATGELLTPLNSRPDVADVLAGHAATMNVSADGAEQFVAYSPVGILSGGVLVSQPAASAFAPALRDLRLGLGLLVLLLVAIGTAAWLVVRRLAALYEAVATARQRAVFLAEASKALSAEVEQAAGMDVATRLAVPVFAAMCLVDAVDERGRIVRTAGRHRNASLTESMRIVEQYPPREGGNYGAARVIATGVPELIEHVAPEHATRIAQGERHLAALRELGNQSLLIVPLRARGRTVGAVTFGRDSSMDAYTEEDLRLAEDLVERIALTLDNGRLYGDLTQALRTRDMFIASASHDLRSPLAVVIGVAQLIQRQLTRTGQLEPGTLTGRLQEIERAGRRIEALVSAMLDLSALDLGHPIPLKRGDTELVGLAEHVAEDFRVIASGHQIEVRAAAPELHGHWDEARLDRMLRNLVDNAVKYSPDGGPISIVIECEGAAPDQTVVITIRDSGIGIAPDELDRVFDRFYRGTAASVNTYGSGIGLASARQVVVEHGGTIELASEAGNGTVITVRLPLAPAESSSRPQAEVAASTPR